jgi:hypothetical protein
MDHVCEVGGSVVCSSSYCVHRPGGLHNMRIQSKLIIRTSGFWARGKVYLRCGKQSVRVCSLNHDITTSGGGVAGIFNRIIDYILYLIVILKMSQ